MYKIGVVAVKERYSYDIVIGVVVKIRMTVRLVEVGLKVGKCV